MAETLQIFIVKKTLRRGLSIITDDIMLGFSIFHDELKQIQESLTVILAFFQISEDYTIIDNISFWVKTLQEVAYEAEDVLDDLAYEYFNHKVTNSNLLFQHINLLKNVKLASRVKNLNQLLKEIKNEVMSFHLQFISGDGVMLHIDLDRVNDLALEDTVVGREPDVSKIVNLMTIFPNQQILTVIPIVGMIGLGKTVLARLVCEQAMARKLFEVRIWVSGAQSLNEESILRRIWQSLDKATESPINTDAVLQQLGKKLAKKKFLLILDGVWSDVFDWWDGLRSQLLHLCTNNGNVTLVTTSFEEVAFHVQTSSQHRHTLGVLSDEECWSIVKERAFRNVTTSIPSNLEAIGRKLAKKCGGVPLAAKVLGGTMGFNVDEKAWLDIGGKEHLLQSSSYQDVKSVLMQCFDQLPTSLKHAFAFCIVFLEGYSIRKEELIQLWMTEGIIDTRDQGNKYFNALLENSFFKDVERTDDGDVIICKIHGIMHDIAYQLFKSSIETWSTLAANASCAHHLYVYYKSSIDPMMLMLLNNRADKLRTIILDRVSFQESWKLERLRSLSFNGLDMKMLPSSIGKLTHLRYLGVFITKIPTLPKSIGKLYHLETLNLSNTDISTLPKSIFKLQNLQNLILSNSKLMELPESIAKLHLLQTLNASHTNIKELPKSFSKLQNLHTLNLSNSKISEFPESITDLQNLQTLILSNSNIKELPETITKLQSLQTLDVSKSTIKEFPESITNLCKLQTLKFLRCNELGNFPKKEMINMVNLENIFFSYEHQMPFGLRNLTCLQTLPFFVVSSDLGGSIEELQFLNKLGCNMEITRLEEVRDKEEGKRANLQGKTRMHGLGFQWSYGETSRVSKDEELLEVLRPNSNIKRIKIKHYMGEKWPSWMLPMKHQIGVDSFTVLNNLVDLTLEQCWNNPQLPRLGDLPYLKFLKINHMGRVKCIDNDFYGINLDISQTSNKSLKPFPSLKSFSISWMENLIEWSSPSDCDKVVVFPCLESLSIQSCHELKSFPLCVMSSLVKIEIKDCEELRFVLYKQQSFPHLTSLSIVGCPKFTELQNWLLSKLSSREFFVGRCQWLFFIPKELGNLSSLTSLAIYCCKRLKYFSEEILCELTLLKYLSIGAFSEELDDFSYLNRVKDLQWLEELEIWGSDFLDREMSILPNQLQHLTALKSLKIMGFTTMEELPKWLGNLQSLNSLSLNYCRNLGCQSTITIFQLSNLANVCINSCPVLKESNYEWLKCLDNKKIKVGFSNGRV